MNRFVVLNANHDVALALVNLSSGERLAEVELISDIPAGHKFSLRELSEGEPVRKYGQIIGKAKSMNKY